MARCNTITIPRDELERLMAQAKKCDPDCLPTRRTVKKKTATKRKTVKKRSTKPIETISKPKTVRNTKKGSKAVRTVSKNKSRSKAKSKSVSKNRNINTNNNNVSVDVRANPRAVSNVYIIAPPQTPMPVMEAPKMKRRDREIPYNAPYLQRRDGSAPMIPAPSRTRVVERQVSAPRMPTIVLPSGKKGRTVQVSAPVTETIPAITQAAPATQAALPPAQKTALPSASRSALPSGVKPTYYQFADGSRVVLEDCNLFDDPVQKANCQARNRKVAKLE